MRWLRWLRWLRWPLRWPQRQELNGYSDWGWDMSKEQLQEVYNRAATEAMIARERR